MPFTYFSNSYFEKKKSDISFMANVHFIFIELNFFWNSYLSGSV